MSAVRCTVVLGPPLRGYAAVSRNTPSPGGVHCAGYTPSALAPAVSVPPAPPSLRTTRKSSVSGKFAATPGRTTSSACTATGPAPTTPPSPGVTVSAAYLGAQPLDVQASYGAQAGVQAPPSSSASTSV
ncbi:hypothetical protein [Archangium sp.]|uniref:hypothetical protein n=1 Tax=Archangium sp. TaxID=1872627 RepID=UPI00286D1530|nr:hypothetical protein [Archangium sp.]